MSEPILVRAAVARDVNQLTIERVRLDPPKPYEVLVQIRAAGICHSDLHTLQGEMRATPPLVLGHEGAGVVVEVGSEVTHVKPGDHIIVSWMPACGVCPQCREGRSYLCARLFATTFRALMPDGTTRLSTLDGMPLKHYLSAATLADYAVLDGASAIPIPDDVPFDVAAITGCGVVTGAGAVLNTAHAQAGQSAAVIGCGGVGLSAVLGCVLAGCYPIVGIDTVESKLKTARALGATHTLHARPGQDLTEALKEVIDGGPEYIFDSVGAASTVAQSLDGVRPGGTAVVMGLHGLHQQIPITLQSLVYQNKHLVGSFFGSSDALVDLPALIEYYRVGRMAIDRLIQARYTLDELPEAFVAMERGAYAGRGVVLFDEHA